MSASTDQRDQRRTRRTSSGQQGQPGGRGGRGGAQRGINRFPEDDVINYGDLHELPLGEEELVAIDAILAQMTTFDQGAYVPAGSICDWLSWFSGKSSGHAARRRTTVFRLIAPSQAATDSAEQYEQRGPKMANDEAEQTSRLVKAEDLLLRYYSGQPIDLEQLENTLMAIAAAFSELDGCHLLEGSARAMLAAVQLRRSINFKTGQFDEHLLGKSVKTMRHAIELRGRGIPDVRQLVDALDRVSATSIGAHTATRHPGQRVPA